MMSMLRSESGHVNHLAGLIHPLKNVLGFAKNFDITLIGEASHGTREFYEFRCNLTKRLIEHHGCKGVCIEGDWPDTATLHHFVTEFGGSHENATADATLKESFSRFPTWMWQNHSMKNFLIWLRDFNSKQQPQDRCGIFGLDVYSLHASKAAVVDYLMENNYQLTAADVIDFYSCFDKYGDDPQRYGMLTSKKYKMENCHGAVVKAYHEVLKVIHKERLKEVRTQAASPPPIPAFGATTDKDDVNMAEKIKNMDKDFIFKMNAKVVVGAESYYRSMFDPQKSSWEVRDSHFMAVMELVREHLSATRSSNKVAVWAHNSHLGNASYSHYDRPKEFNLGQLVKEKYPTESIAIGQFTHNGTVMAAEDWDSMHEIRKVNDSLPGSYENVFHRISAKMGRAQYSLYLHDPEVKKEVTALGPLLNRAIGVIYRPDTERQSHYFQADMCGLFDVAVWFDKTHAVAPLSHDEPPAIEIETFPSGL